MDPALALVSDRESLALHLIHPSCRNKADHLQARTGSCLCVMPMLLWAGPTLDEDWAAAVSCLASVPADLLNMLPLSQLCAEASSAKF